MSIVLHCRVDITLSCCVTPGGNPTGMSYLYDIDSRFARGSEL